MAKRSSAQKERQRDEHRDKGKYARMNPCEICGKSAGANYYSHPMTNEWGVGLVLCKRHADATSDFTTKLEFVMYRQTFLQKNSQKL